MPNEGERDRDEAAERAGHMIELVLLAQGGTGARAAKAIGEIVRKAYVAGWDAGWLARTERG